MLKRLLYIFTLSLALTSFCQPAQASPDINIDEDVADEPEKAIAYRYWIDDNSEKTEVAFNGEDIETNIDVSDYSIGVHIYHLQLRLIDGRLSSIKDIPFYAGYKNQETKEKESPVEKIVYWLGDNYDEQTTVKYEQADISINRNIADLTSGNHTYTVMAYNSNHQATIAEGSFYIPDESTDDSGEKEVITYTSYQYWIDEDLAHAKTVAYSSNDIKEQIDYTNLAEGAHVFNFRLRTNEGIWSQKYQYSFYTPAVNGTEQPETQQPITGYRFGTNGMSTYKDLTEVDNVPSLAIEIPFPAAKDYLNVEKYDFSADNTSNNDVKVNANGHITYYVQFKNKLDKWGEPIYVDSIVANSTIRKAKDLVLQRALGIRKIKTGDYDIVKFTVDETNGYFFGASENCKVLFYQDNKRTTTFTEEQMLSNKSMLLTPGSYFAVIYDQDKDGSIRLTNTSNWVADPVINYGEDHKLSITTETANAQIHYTTDGSMPTSESPVYTEPITMTYNGVVKAIALCDGMADSFIKSYDVNDFETQTCTLPTISYDGRKIKLTADVANANIYYTEDGSNPTVEDGLMYNSEDGINVKSLGSIKAITTKDLMNNSAVATYEIPAYYDGKSQVEVEKAGNLSKAFEWNNGDIATDTLKVLGNINATDVASLKTMAGIQYLDLNKVNIEGNALPDQAFAKMNLKTASLPASLTACGKELFAGNKQLAAVTWNANSNMPAEVLSGIDNPNLLLYVNTKSYAPASLKNVVAGGIADNITLTEPSAEQASAGNFYVPTPFTAKKISYTRNFKQETEIGICQGWETISLPFDAQTITHEENGKIAPFAKGDAEAKPFWLYELAPNGGFQATATMKANTPYIISMPNSQSYSDEYILGGNVTFSAENVEIGTTQQASAKNNNREFVTSFEQVDKTNGIYALNVGEKYEGYLPGSIFVENFMNVRPFEAYLTTAEAAARFSREFGGGTTGIESIPLKEVNGIKVWANGSTLNIQSDKTHRIQVFSTMGMLVRSEHVEAGETLTITNLPSGIYIVNNKKVAVR